MREYSGVFSLEGTAYMQVTDLIAGTYTMFCKHTISALTVALALTSCAAKQPVLYPNNHLKTVGADAALSDIESCTRLATRSGAGQNRAESIPIRQA